MVGFKVILGSLGAEVYFLAAVVVYGAESVTRGSSLIRPSGICEDRQIR